MTVFDWSSIFWPNKPSCELDVLIVADHLLIDSPLIMILYSSVLFAAVASLISMASAGLPPPPQCMQIVAFGGAAPPTPPPPASPGAPPMPAPPPGGNKVAIKQG